MLLRPLSVNVVMLLLASASKFRPNLSLPTFPTDFHANVAALLGTGLLVETRRDLEDDFFPLRSDDLKVVSMLLPFSGLGLREVFFIGGTKEEDDGPLGRGIDGEKAEDAEGLLPTTAISELCFEVNKGLCGSGGPGLERSG